MSYLWDSDQIKLPPIQNTYDLSGDRSISGAAGKNPAQLYFPLDLAANRLILTVQPQEGLTLELIAKKPGPKLCMGELGLDFRYASILDRGEAMPDAYERLLLDCMLGDQTLFLRSDTVRLA